MKPRQRETQVKNAIILLARARWRLQREVEMSFVLQWTNDDDDDDDCSTKLCMIHCLPSPLPPPLRPILTATRLPSHTSSSPATSPHCKPSPPPAPSSPQHISLIKGLQLWSINEHEPPKTLQPENKYMFLNVLHAHYDLTISPPTAPFLTTISTIPHLHLHTTMSCSPSPSSPPAPCRERATSPPCVCVLLMKNFRDLLPGTNSLRCFHGETLLCKLPLISIARLAGRTREHTDESQHVQVLPPPAARRFRFPSAYQKVFSLSSVLLLLCVPRWVRFRPSRARPPPFPEVPGGGNESPGAEIWRTFKWGKNSKAKGSRRILG